MQKQVVEGFRLSPQQEHLWMLQQAEQRRPFRAQCAVLLEGRLDVKHLQKSLDRLVERHEILRTTFQRLTGMSLPLQVIAEQSKVVLEVFDAEGMDERQLQEFVRELMAGGWAKVPESERLPLLEASLVRQSPEHHVLILSLPALCADTYSLRNLVAELTRHYAAFAGPAPAGPEADEGPLQYNVVSEWLNEILESEETSAGRDFWLRKEGTHDEHWYGTTDSTGRDQRLPLA